MEGRAERRTRCQQGRSEGATRSSQEGSNKDFQGIESADPQKSRHKDLVGVRVRGGRG